MAETQRTRFYAVHDFDRGSCSINLDNVAYANPFRRDDPEGGDVRGINIYFNGGRVLEVRDTFGGYRGLLAHLRLDGMVEAYDAAREEEEAAKPTRPLIDPDGRGAHYHISGVEVSR